VKIKPREDSDRCAASLCRREPGNGEGVQVAVNGGDYARLCWDHWVELCAEGSEIPLEAHP
jgi:hypothetical protein